MDGQQPSHQPHLPDDHNPNLAAASYAAFYSSEQDPSPYSLAYNTQPYQVVQHAPVPPPRQISQTDLAHHHQQAAGLQFHNLSLMSPSQFQPTVYNPPQQHVPVSISGSPPQSPNMYDPLSPPISGSDTSADSVYHHHHHHHPHQHQHQPHHPTHSRNSSATGSPPSSRSSLVHRNSNPIRYNPTPSPTSSSSRRRGRSVHDSDEEDIMGVDISSNLAHTRKEATRRQRIEAEQRRRDELRDGYAKLKEVLPISNQKSSKVSLLERATNHIVSMDKMNQELLARVDVLEAEVKRLQKLNEKISLGVANTPSPGHPNMTIDSRPLSPPPETGLPHSLASVKGQEPPREESRSPSNPDDRY